MANELNIGDYRLGHCFDGDSDTPVVACLVSRSKGFVRLDIPWTEGSGEIYKRWFAHPFETPSSPVVPVALPPQVLFRDAKGTIALVGLRDIGVSSDILRGDGVGHLIADFAVLGVPSGVDYTTVHGLQSGIDGLGRFMESRSVTMDASTDEDRPAKWIDIRADVQREAMIPGEFGLSLHPSAAVSYGGQNEVTLFDTAYVQTRYAAPVAWGQHLRLHRGIGDLVAVAFGKSAAFTSHHALRVSVTAPGEDGLHSTWCPVVTHQTGIGTGTSLLPQDLPLFTLRDIGSEGVAKWLTIHEQWSRAILPLAGLTRMKDTFLEAQFVQMGIGLEALGYFIARRSGMGRERADNLPFEEKIRRILSDAITERVDEEWAEDTARLYAAAKHVDRTAPDPHEMLARLESGERVFRLWVAQELGVQPDAIADHLLL